MNKLDKQFGKLIIIAGPTAIGKSGLAIRLAKEIGGEVISADSMQVYKGMDIGTAKVTAAEMDGIPHHLIDILDPSEEFSAPLFKELAMEACAGIYSRGHIPIICGGTGFYIQALLYDVDFKEEADHDEELRAALWKLYDEKGGEPLRQILNIEDPVTAATMDFNNIKRVIRAIEYHKIHGGSIRRHNEEEREKQWGSPFDHRFFVLTGDRKALTLRIDARVDKMMEDGLLEEARALYERKIGPGLSVTAAQAIGYKELFNYFDGSCSLEAAVEQIKINSRQYSKRQQSWFKREKTAVTINIDEGDPLDEIRKYLW
ncbi:MAG: tRNA (adenosine(37)-N6)-dimethylallyltransferase MiaA [Eubacteriales bacterium]|nr:tRNA (adenosine(37)-N6)-dimethylallyltransferase MiaA [Eubacteriales bacterium]